MIFITGDCHGGFQRFGVKYFSQQRKLGREDFVIICGDFGGVWSGSAEENYWLDWLEGKPFTTLFVDGNHENFDMLGALPEQKWHGGRVHRVREHVLHLMRGQIFEISGLTCSPWAAPPPMISGMGYWTPQLRILKRNTGSSAGRDRCSE